MVKRRVIVLQQRAPIAQCETVSRLENVCVGDRD